MGRGERCRKFFAEAVDDLIAFAEWSFRLDRRLDDGTTQRDHGEAAERMIANLPGWKGKREIIPPSPPFPEALEHVWTWFRDISMGLSSSGMGPALVTWESLQAWRLLTGEEIEDWEARALVRLGHARAMIEGERMQADAKRRVGTA